MSRKNSDDDTVERDTETQEYVTKTIWRRDF